MRLRALTLVEVMVVVAVLGILAAIITPQFQGHITRAKEAAAKDNLCTVRVQIQLYKVDHKGRYPGYWKGMQAPATTLKYQFIGTSAEDGSAVASTVKSGEYIYGPYLKQMPINPFNELSGIRYLADGVDAVNAVDGMSGWLYKKETGEIFLNWPGTDSQGVKYCDY
jgi:general secretion pathway protein G